MITRLQIFDAEIEDIKKEFVTFTEGNSFNDFFHSDPDGGLWFRIDRKDEILIAKVDGKNAKIEYLNSTLDTNIDNFGFVKEKFNYYGVAFTTNTMEKEIHIYYVDAENKTVELYTEEKICFDYYWKAEIRKNRIYLIKHEGNETAYIYFDIDTKKFSDVKIFKTEDIIKGK